ncbi:hypothetical protein SMD22_00225 (plasmid) [Brevibacillus halotolerans]|nr:hypothetical protein SMD22_00225 [Brevibacillus halotolerans]
MSLEKINSIISSLSQKEKEALKEAIAPIYFEDRADYIRGLWNVVNVLIGDKIDMDEVNTKEWLYVLEPDLNV